MSRTRYEKRIRSRLTVRFGVNNTENVGFTEDISEHGIFLKTARTFPVQTELRIELTTDDDHVIRFLGEVKYSKQVAPSLVWSDRDAGMGIHVIRFVEGRNYFDRLLMNCQVA